MADENKLRIEFSPLFNKKLKTLSTKIIISFRETLDLFWDNPNHKNLRRHFLRGKYSGYQSIDITGDYRAIFKEIKIRDLIIIRFYSIGTHQDLYG